MQFHLLVAVVKLCQTTKGHPKKSSNQPPVADIIVMPATTSKTRDKVAYAEIAPGPGMNGSGGGGTDEATPLASNLYRRAVSQSKTLWGRQWAVLGTAVVVVGLALSVLLWNHRGNGAVPVPGFQVDEEPSHPAILYRPVCEYYYFSASQPTDQEEGSPVRLIQTSMKAPSQQWSILPCTTPVANKNVPPTLNEYGAPDAIFKVNFSAPAFDRDQAILGFGGAFTESAALNYHRLSQEGKDAVAELLFGKSGLGYSLGRVHINSCDFSVKSYSFDETEDDFDLLDFDESVRHDVESGMVDMALRAASVYRAAFGGNDNDGEPDFKLYASPWSPPAWMKQPTWEDKEGAIHAQHMTYSAGPVCLRDGVGTESRYAKAWALYFSKFLTAYKNLGLPLWAITVQNEPEFPAPWEACSYTPTTQKDFVANHLGPQLRTDHPDVKLFVFDHNKDHVNVWAEEMLNASSDAAQYVDGTAYHWYAGGKSFCFVFAGANVAGV